MILECGNEPQRRCVSVCVGREINGGDEEGDEAARCVGTQRAVMVKARQGR